MGILIDTSVLIDIERSGQGLQGLLDKLGGESPVIAAITASELLHGVHRATGAMRRERRSHFVEAILEALAVLAFDLPTARIHSQLWADLQSRGTVIGAHDQIIAATALRHELALVTGNVREFRRVEGLQVLALSGSASQQS